jgi:hypothetical protein
VITGFVEREALAVAELRDGVLVPAGLVKLGLARICGSASSGCAPGPRPIRALSQCDRSCSPGFGISGAPAPAGFGTAYSCPSGERSAATRL